MKKKIKEPTALEKKRMTILRDAIKQIELNVYNVITGTYIDLKNGDYYGNMTPEDVQAVCDLPENINFEETELKKFIPQLINKTKPCRVCAKGALTISGIAKFNNFKLSEVEDLDSDASSYTRKLFGQSNADTMESYFEGANMGKNKNNFDYIHCIDFYNTYDDDKERLLVILRNSLKNKGIFKPKQIVLETE